MKSWGQRIFVDHADLYGEVLESLKPRGGPEVRGLRKLLARHGVPRGSRLLDVACGVGRHIVPLAGAGYHCIGSDLSPTYIDRARAFARERRVAEDRIRFYVADYRRIDRVLHRAGERPVDAALSLFTSMGHGTEADDLAAFRAVRRTVRPGGLFVLEMGSRDWVLGNFHPHNRVPPAPDGSIEIDERRRFDWSTSMMHSLWTFYRRKGRSRRKVLAQEIRVRMYSLHELRGMFERAGWECVGAYGSLAKLEPVSFTTRRLVVVGRRPRR